MADQRELDFLPKEEPRTEELEARLALLVAAGGSPRTARQAVARFGSGLSAVRSPSLPARLREGLSKAAVDARRELDVAAQLGARWILPPPGFSDAALLCVRGDIPGEMAISIVGSRNADAYGVSVAEALARALTGCGIVVASGAASGVDRAAHRATIEQGGQTVAFLGEGLAADRRSAEKRSLLDVIAATGAVISEYLTRASGSKYTFPERNRLIAAYGRAVVVVQGTSHSGSLNTARHAREHGRPVFAVPGDVTSPLSAGPNALIAAGHARLLAHPRDLAEVVEAPALAYAAWPSGPRAGVPRGGAGTGVRAEPGARVLHALSAGPLSFDELAVELPDLPADLAEILLDLELKGQLRRLRGDRFEATGG